MQLWVVISATLILVTTETYCTRQKRCRDHETLKDVLSKSILFYEAQRSGKLPPDSRIYWRGDSALDDGQDNGVDLSGGWYDAGDHLKLGLPMASTVLTLTWGLVEFEEGYKQAGEYTNMIESVKWGLDYLIKCHTGPNEFYIQVGDSRDHSYWGRPEDMTMFRPSFKLNETLPGSEIVADAASAMAAGYIAFKQVDPEYADLLLQHAKELYNFAYDFQGLYIDSVPEAGTYYPSYQYKDELCLGAAWLYRATGNQTYLDKALEFYQGYVPWAFSWSDQIASSQILMYMLTGEQRYADAVSAFIESYLPDGKITYTPGGLAFRNEWGSLRYSANTGFIAALAIQNNISKDESEAYIRQQFGYILGDNPYNISYVIGVGNNYPLKPHHRSSSCSPNHKTRCSWRQYHSIRPNPSVLVGALVGGPDEFDNYEDERNNYVSNEVAIDYNAGFQSAIAGMIKLGIIV